MAAQKGKDLLLKTGDGAGSFTTFAGLRARALARELFFNGTIRPWQIVVPDFGAIEGPFQITSLEYRGDHLGEVTFDIALESAGELGFTPL